MVRDLKLGVQVDARDAERGLERVADSMERTGRAAERMGDKFASSSGAAVALGRQVDQLGDQARKSARDVDELGDQLDQVSRKNIGARLSGIVAKFASFGSRAAKGFGDALSKALPSSLSSIASNPPVLAAVTAAGAALGGLLAGAITSAILLGVGGGVLLTGLISAFKDPRVDEALRGKISTFQEGLGRKGQQQILGSPKEIRTTEGLLDKAARVFKQLGQPFVAPLVSALESASTLLDRITPKLEALFGTMTPAVEPLFRALGDIVERSLPGLQSAAAASVPLFEKLAEHAPKIGEMFSKVFQIFADAGPQASVALGDLLTFLEKLIPFIAQIIADLAVFWAGLHEGAVRTKDVVVGAFSWMTQRVLEHLGLLVNGAAKAFGWIPQIGDPLELAAKKFNEFATKVNISLASIKDRDVEVRVRMSGTNIGGKRVPVGEGGTIPIRGAFADGGPVPGAPGSPQLILAHGGEYVLSREMLARGSAAMMAGTAATVPPVSGGTVRHVVELILNGQMVRSIVIDAADRRGQTVAQYLGSS